MRIGLFRPLFSWVSGVATYSHAEDAVGKNGTPVFIFTTTDRDVDRYEDWQIVRIPVLFA